MAESLRLDKWLWAARFFKTRALASIAVSGGKVHLNHKRVKPGRAVTVGDGLQIQRGNEAFEVEIRAIISSRRPAAEAQLLYAEHEASTQARADAAESRRLIPRPIRAQGRPSKQQRRQLVRLKRELE